MLALNVTAPASRCSILAPTCLRPGRRAPASRLLQAILGIQPDAPNDRLYVDPDLPEWLPDVTLLDLRLGRRHLDIRFRRDGDKNVWDVLRGDAHVVAYRSSVEAREAMRRG